MSTVIRTGPLPVMGSEKLTVSTTTKTLTAASYDTSSGVNHKKAGMAIITIETAPIRVSFDPAVAPVDASSTGHVFATGTVITLDSYRQIQNFQAVRNGGSDSTINVTYYEGA